jgi:hypothetical protein
MDVLIELLPPPYIEGSTIWCTFVAIGRVNGSPPLLLTFRLAYQFGTTLAQKQTAIKNAAAAARDAYATAHGVTLPAVASIEILGV